MIQLWIAATEVFHNEPYYTAGLSFLDTVRLEKLWACRQTEDKVRSLCCGLLLQKAVGDAQNAAAGKRTEKDFSHGKSVENEMSPDGRASACRSEKWEIAYHYGPYGKPCFAGYPRLHFSLSHSGGYAAIALAETELGLDLQQRRPIRETMLRKVLSPEEYAYCMSLPEKARQEDWFLRCWCAGESYGKLTGCGLRQPLAELSLERDGTMIRRRIQQPQREADGRRDRPHFPDSGEEPGYVRTEFVYCREYRPVPEYYMNLAMYPLPDGSRPVFPDTVTDVTAQLLERIMP